MNDRFGRSADRDIGVGVTEDKIVRPAKAKMHRRIDLDHVLIAAEQQRLLGLPLKSAGAMLHVPFVCCRLCARRAGTGPKADLDHLNSAGLDPAAARSARAVCSAGRARCRAGPFSRNARRCLVIGLQPIESVEQHQYCDRDQGRTQKLAAPAPDPLKTAGRMDRPQSLPAAGIGVARIQRSRSERRPRSIRSKRSEFIITSKDESWWVKAAPMGPSFPVAQRTTATGLTTPAKRKIFCHDVFIAWRLTSISFGSFSSEVADRPHLPLLP